MSTTTLQNHPSVEELFNDVDTIPLALFEHLDFSFLTDFPVFAPDPWGRTREHDPSALFKGVLYCFSREIYSPEEIAKELQDELLSLQCGFDRSPSHESIRRFLIDLSVVVEDVFEHFVEQVADRDLLDNVYRIDGTDVHADRRDEEASWNYDSTAEEADDELDRSEDAEQDTSETEQDEDPDDRVASQSRLNLAAAFQFGSVQEKRSASTGLYRSNSSGAVVGSLHRSSNSKRFCDATPTLASVTSRTISLRRHRIFLTPQYQCSRSSSIRCSTPQG